MPTIGGRVDWEGEGIQIHGGRDVAEMEKITEVLNDMHVTKGKQTKSADSFFQAGQDLGTESHNGSFKMGAIFSGS